MYENVWKLINTYLSDMHFVSLNTIVKAKKYILKRFFPPWLHDCVGATEGKTPLELVTAWPLRRY